jgi:hypothetical protein
LIPIYLTFFLKKALYRKNDLKLLESIKKMRRRHPQTYAWTRTIDNIAPLIVGSALYKEKMQSRTPGKMDDPKF